MTTRRSLISGKRRSQIQFSPTANSRRRELLNCPMYTVAARYNASESAPKGRKHENEASSLSPASLLLAAAWRWLSFDRAEETDRNRFIITRLRGLFCHFSDEFFSRIIGNIQHRKEPFDRKMMFSLSFIFVTNFSKCGLLL